MTPPAPIPAAVQPEARRFAQRSHVDAASCSVQRLSFPVQPALREGVSRAVCLALTESLDLRILFSCPNSSGYSGNGFICIVIHA